MRSFLINIILLVLLNIFTLFNKDNVFIGIAIFGLLTYIPGSNILSLIKYNNKTIMEKISLYTGFGTLFLILLGLGVNELLPLLGITRPLSQAPLMLSYNGAVMLLILGAYITNRHLKTIFKIPRISLPTIIFILTSSLIPIIAILGAVSLNNNGTNLIAFSTYILIGLYTLLIFIFNKKLSSNKITFALFITSLALLFMNSFRGWYNTGHDVQREFYVFNLTNVNKLWDMALYKDPYNACLSLTILPTIYSSITKINDYFIFKILYQFIFSFTVVNIFYLLRRYFSKSFVYLASLNFLFFPTFMTDMPMLNRQELAFFFLSLMFYILFDNTVSKVKKTTLFITMSTGMIMSHYSTSYVATALFWLTYFSSLLFILINKLAFKKNKIPVFASHLNLNQNLNVFMVLFPLLFTIFWNGIYTKTSENIQDTLVKIANNITQPFQEKEKTGETLYSIFSYKPVPPETSLDRYLQETTKKLRLQREEEAYYNKNTYSKYPITLHDQEILKPGIPLQYFNNSANSIDLISKIRESYAKLMQILIVIGLGLFIFYKKHSFNVPKEFYFLSIISLIMIAAQVVLPQSAIGYGILRFYQQSLMIFSIFIVLGLYWILKIFVARKIFIRELIVVIVILVYFFLLSGVIPQVIGGYYPQLPLNNKGTYYNMYYTHKSEITALEWIKPFANKKTPLQSDSFDAAKIKTYAKSYPIAATFPAVVRKSSYVYLNYSNAILNSVFLYTNGGLIIYKYPIEFLNDNKNLIYSSSEARIYR